MALPKIPKPRKIRAQTPVSNAPQPEASTGPDLSMIADALRPLAVPCSDLEFDPANPRSHDEENLSAIRASLKTFGQRKPIVANRRTKQIEAGNGTLQGALALGWSHVAVVWVDDDDKTATGFSIADNRSAELAIWDDKNLRDALKTLEAPDKDLADMLAKLEEEAKALAIPPIEPVDTKAPPKLTWLLIGIPLDEFGKVQAHVAALQQHSSITVQSNRDEENGQ